MDGDMTKMRETIRLDGKADAIGLGGITGLFPVGVRPILSGVPVR